MSSTITTTEVVDQFGDYYINQGQNANDIKTQLFANSDTEDIFVDKRIGDDTILRGSPVDIDDVLQGYQDTYTPQGNATFGAVEIPLYELKIDVTFNPTNLYQSWLGFLTSPSIDRTEWPFIRWYIEKLLLPRAKDNWERKGIFWGVKGSITPGTVQPVNQAVNGIRKQINDAITAGDITPLTMGAVPTDPVDFVTYIETMTENTDPILRATLDQWNMSKTLAARFRQGMRLKYNMAYNQADLMMEINYGIPIKGYLSHEQSTKIWATFALNRTLGIKQPGNDTVFKVETAKRDVNIFTDYFRGTGFWRPDMIVTNDQDLS